MSTGKLNFHIHIYSFHSLYAKGRVLGYKRSKVNQSPNTTLVKIEGVTTKEETQFYLGKHIAYVYRAKREVRFAQLMLKLPRKLNYFRFSG